MRDLRGRTALVTGASKGIGVHIARRLAGAGCSLVICARSEELLLNLKKELESAHNVSVLAVPLDLAEKDSLSYLGDTLTAANQVVDILVNNAALIEEKPFDETNFHTVEQILSVNVRGVMGLTHLLLPTMIQQGAGHIVNVASLAGLGGVAFAEAYCASKHAVVGFGRSLRGSMQIQQTGVGVSTICPGYVSEAGMFARLSERTGQRAPINLGVSKPEAVAAAVERAIRKNLPEVVVNPMPVRFFIAIQALFPRLAERIGHVIGIHNLYKRAVDIDKKANHESH